MPAIDSLSKTIEIKAKSLVLPRDAAGRKMTSKVPIIPQDYTIGETREYLFENSKNFESINYVYVVSKSGKLIGVASIREILSSKPSLPVGKIMIQEIVKAHPKTNQEKIAHLAVKNNIKAVPIVDDKNNLLGVVPSDSILKILDQEYHEDFLRFSGIVGQVHQDELLQIPFYFSFLRRMPWILIGLFGGLFAAEVISQFDLLLEKHIILASFIPLVAYIANAVGVQTQTLFIRDLATSSQIKFTKYAIKQILISVAIAFSCWLVIGLIASLLWGSLQLGLVIGLAVFAAILVATFFALFIPFSLLKFKLDPAIGSGPFTTIIQDLLSIVIYFKIVSQLI